jgi:hypothetical protein
MTDGQESRYVRSEVLTAVKMSMLLFWVVTPCRLVGCCYKRFGRKNCPFRTEANSTLKMERVCFSETLVCTYKSKWRELEAETISYLVLQTDLELLFLIA